MAQNRESDLSATVCTHGVARTDTGPDAVRAARGG